MNKTALRETEHPNPNRSTWEDLLEVRNRPTGTFAPAPEWRTLPATVLGKVLGFAASGLPLVDFQGNPERDPLPARHTCSISPADIGRGAVLVFEHNDPRKPIVLGLLHPLPPDHSTTPPQTINAALDGKQVTLTAENEIVLRCGKASITLTRAGKVLINGEYLLSRSNGVNRIKGGSVQIN